MTISERMFQIMEEQGISQYRLSKMTGISTRTISDWRSKKTNPGADKIMVICEALQVSPETLLTGRGQTESSGSLPHIESEIKEGAEGQLVGSFHTSVNVSIGEVCLLTNDVRKLADFYKGLLGIDNGSNDETHQFIISEGTTLTVYNDGTEKNNQNRNISLAFTVEDIEKEYRRVLELGARIIEPPTRRPWGAVNMSFCDPDNNVIYFRQFQ